MARPNLQRLEELKPYFPPRLQRFADNFFTTCEPFTDEANYYNFMNDVDSYALSAKVYKQYRGRLKKLFYEVVCGHRQRWEMPKEKAGKGLSSFDASSMPHAGSLNTFRQS